MRHRRDPLVEREAELAALRAALHSAGAGRGTALLIEGEAGIGKTALLSTAGDDAREAGAWLLTAHGTPLDEGVAYGVARQLLLPALLEGENRERLLRGAASLAEPALFGSDDQSAAPGEATSAIRLGLTWLVATMAGTRGPLVLVVDDMHWADGPSVRFLHALSAQADDLPVALLLAARPRASWSEPGLAAELTERMRVLRPARLSPDGVGTALARRLRAEPAREFAAAAHTETAGTPYLVAALADALSQEGIEPTSERVSAIGRLGAAEVGRHVGARIQSLSPEARALGQAVAVLGDGRPAAEAQRVAGVEPGATAARAAAALEAAGLVHGWPEPSFDHPLVRTAVLDDLGAAGRAELHGRAADLAMSSGEVERAAAHLTDVPGCGSPARADALRRAGAHALHRGAPDVAVRHLRRALAEPPIEADRSDVLLDLGMSEMALGDPLAPGRLVAAAEAATGPDARLRAYIASARALTYMGRWWEAFDCLGGAIAEAATTSPDILGFARLELAAGMLSCVPTGRRAIALLRGLDRELPPDSVTRPLFEGVAAVCDVTRGLARDGVLDRVARAGPSALPEHAGTFVQGMPVVALVLADAFREAEAALQALLAGARQRLDITTVRVLSAWHGVSLARSGRLAEAEEAALAVDHDEAPGALPIAELLAAVVQATVALERGDLARASAWADRPLEHDPRVAETHFCDYLRVVRGQVHLASGEPARALELFTQAGASQTHWGGESPPVTQWRMHAALAAHAAGSAEQARSLIEEEVLAAQAFGAPRPLAAALRARAVIAREDAARAERDLREATDVLDGSAADLERAHVAADLGALLLRDGRTAESREVLRPALDLAWMCGADAVAGRIRGALAQAGVRPRREATGGLRALTPSEARTARVAASGATNREIAEALFVTEKTVETHLTAAYRKLNIAGRLQLGAALGASQGVSAPKTRVPPAGSQG